MLSQTLSLLILTTMGHRKRFYYLHHTDTQYFREVKEPAQELTAIRLFNNLRNSNHHCTSETDHMKHFICKTQPAWQCSQCVVTPIACQDCLILEPVHSRTSPDFLNRDYEFPEEFNNILNFFLIKILKKKKSTSQKLDYMDDHYKDSI